jgi:2-hydroxychromene-2-carboxylate isomerase
MSVPNSARSGGRVTGPRFDRAVDTKNAGALSSTVKVSWFFDVVSPYAYLAFKRLSLLPATTSVEYVPVLFAGLLSHFGQLGPAEIASKRRFTYRFALWRARQLGIPMRWPDAHPFNPLTAQRLIIAAGSDRQAV